MSTTSSGHVQVPDIGDFDEVPVIEILVSVGDTVSAEDPLITLESDKATMDVPAPFGGVVKAIGVSVGDSVSQGAELMTIEAAEDEGSTSSTEAAPDPGSSAGDPAQTIETAPPTPGEREATGDGASEPAPAPPSNGNGDGDGPIYASPSVRRLARELGVQLRGVDGGSGPQGPADRRRRARDRGYPARGTRRRTRVDARRFGVGRHRLRAGLRRGPGPAAVAGHRL